MLTKRNKDLLVVDLGSSQLKAIVVRDGQLAEHRSVPLPPGAIYAGKVHDPDVVRQLLKSLLTDPIFKRLAVHVVMGASSASSLILRYPSVGEKDRDRRQSGRMQQVEEQLGLLSGDYDIVSQVQREDLLIEEHALALPKSQVGMNVIVGRAASLAATGSGAQYLLKRPDDGRERRAGGPARAIVDIGARQTVVSVIEDDMLRMVRCIEIGGDTFTEAVHSIPTVPNFATAEKAKLRGRLDSSPIGNAMQVVADQLVQSVNETLDDYQQSLEGAGAVKEILLTGGTSELRGLDLCFDSFSMARSVTLKITDAAETPISPIYAAAWARALQILASGEREYDFLRVHSRNAGAKDSGGQSVVLSPGIVIKREQTAGAARKLGVIGIVINLSVIALCVGSWFVIDTVTKDSAGDRSREQAKQKDIAADAPIKGNSGFIARNGLALDLIGRNDRSVRMIQAGDTLSQLLTTRQIPTESIRLSGTQTNPRLTMSGKGTLPPGLGQAELQRIVQPQDVVVAQAKQDPEGYQIILEDS